MKFVNSNICQFCCKNPSKLNLSLSKTAVCSVCNKECQCWDEELLAMYRNLKLSDKIIEKHLPTLRTNQVGGCETDKVEYGLQRFARAIEGSTELPTLESSDLTKRNYDPFDTDMNYNITINGGAGQGKSTLAKWIIDNHIASRQGSKVVILSDNGYCNQYATYLGYSTQNFSQKQPFQLNPFCYWVKGDSVLDQLVTSSVIIMASSNTNLTTYQLSSLKKIVAELLNDKGSDTSIDDVYLKCSTHEDERISNLCGNLINWTRSGKYADYLEPRNELFTSDSIVNNIDISSCSSDQELYIVSLITSFMPIISLTGTAYNRGKSLIVLSIDNEHALDNRNLSEILKILWCNFRTRNISGLSVQYSFYDTLNSCVLNSLYLSSYWFFCLRQEEMMYHEKYCPTKFTDTEMAKLHQLKTLKGRYSQFLLKPANGDNSEVLTLKLPESSRLKFSSDPLDIKRIHSIAKSEGSYRFAIAILELKHHLNAIYTKLETNQDSPNVLNKKLPFRCKLKSLFGL